MQPAYLDTSALVKLVMHERESLDLVSYLQGPKRVVSSALSAVETMRACRRSALAADEVHGLLQSIEQISVDQEIIKVAGMLDPPSIRSLDAIHVASAKRIEDADLEFVTYDARLADAARAHGLRVVQPGR